MLKHLEKSTKDIWKIRQKWVLKLLKHLENMLKTPPLLDKLTENVRNICEN